jgi:hypothetical protein
MWSGVFSGMFCAARKLSGINSKNNQNKKRPRQWQAFVVLAMTSNQKQKSENQKAKNHSVPLSRMLW